MATKLTDPLAALISGVIVLCAVGGLWSRLGLSADDVALGGAALTGIAATIRTIVIRRSVQPYEVA